MQYIRVCVYIISVDLNTVGGIFYLIVNNKLLMLIAEPNAYSLLAPSFVFTDFLMDKLLQYD